MTKQEIVAQARDHGYLATYSGRLRVWVLKRVRPSTNTPAFDRVVFANLTRRLGIDEQVKEEGV